MLDCEAQKFGTILCGSRDLENLRITSLKSTFFKKKLWYISFGNLKRRKIEK